MPTPHGGSLADGEGPYITGSDPVAAELARREIQANPDAQLGPRGVVAPCMQGQASTKKGRGA